MGTRIAIPDTLESTQDVSSLRLPTQARTYSEKRMNKDMHSSTGPLWLTGRTCENSRMSWPNDDTCGLRGYQAQPFPRINKFGYFTGILPILLRYPEGNVSSVRHLMFWTVTPCSLVGGYRRFGGGTLALKIEA